jgi:uncharacterized membrane protein
LAIASSWAAHDILGSVSPAALVALLWIAFAGTHLALASRRVEPALVARLGRNGYLGLYSLVAFACFVPLCQVYFSNRHAGAWLWAVPASGPLRAPIYAGLLFAFVLIAASLLRPSPAGLVPAGDARPGGVYLLTRHPMMTGLALIGLLHLPPNGAASDVAFFGGLALFPLIGAWHQDSRKLASGDPAFRAFHDGTPFFLFTGRETLRGLRELPPLAIGAGLALGLGARWLHGSLW